jgi:hypothetical protein
VVDRDAADRVHRVAVRSGILWWFISLFLGPIATAILAIIPPGPARSRT